MCCYWFTSFLQIIVSHLCVFRHQCWCSVDAAGVPACVKQLSSKQLVFTSTFISLPPSWCISHCLSPDAWKLHLCSCYTLTCRPVCVQHCIVISSVLMFEFSLGVASLWCRKSCSGFVSWFCVKQTQQHLKQPHGQQTLLASSVDFNTEAQSKQSSCLNRVNYSLRDKIHILTAGNFTF